MLSLSTVPHPGHIIGFKRKLSCQGQGLSPCQDQRPQHAFIKDKTIPSAM